MSLLGLTFGSHFGRFGYSGGSFRGVGGSWKQVGFLMYLGTFPGRRQAEAIQKWVVKSRSMGPTQLTIWPDTRQLKQLNSYLQVE